MNFIRHLPVSSEFHSVLALIDRFTKYITLSPLSISIIIVELAWSFNDSIICNLKCLLRFLLIGIANFVQIIVVHNETIAV